MSEGSITDEVRYDDRGAVAVVTIDRQHRRNAVDAEALEQLASAIDEARAADARVLVLTGAGGHFCAGADLTSLDNEAFATRLVWFDALVTNPDRTARNPNLLVWQRAPWMIDHGAALYAQHDWAGTDDARARTAFPLIRDHVLLGRAGDVLAADEAMAATLTPALIDDVVAQVPDALLTDAVGGQEFATGDAAREQGGVRDADAAGADQSDADGCGLGGRGGDGHGVLLGCGVTRAL